MTTFLKKCSILAELWTDYRDHEDLEDFLEYNDMGLPLAYFLATDVVDVTPKAEVYVDETWHLLLACFDFRGHWLRIIRSDYNFARRRRAGVSRQTLVFLDIKNVSKKIPELDYDNKPFYPKPFYPIYHVIIIL